MGLQHGREAAVEIEGFNMKTKREAVAEGLQRRSSLDKLTNMGIFHVSIVLGKIWELLIEVWTKNETFLQPVPLRK